jgi:hypothetical protein
MIPTGIGAATIFLKIFQLRGYWHAKNCILAGRPFGTEQIVSYAIDRRIVNPQAIVICDDCRDLVDPSLSGS